MPRSFPCGAITKLSQPTIVPTCCALIPPSSWATGWAGGTVDQIKLTRCPDLLRCCTQYTPSPASQPLEGQLSLSLCVPAPPLVWEPWSRLPLRRVWGRHNDVGLIQICILVYPSPYYRYSNPNHASTNSAFLRKATCFMQFPSWEESSALRSPLSAPSLISVL